MSKRFVFAALCAAVLSAPTIAQTMAPARDAAATPGVDARQVKQQQRIDQGVQSGQLTTREAARLEKGQQHVATTEARAKADGTVTLAERKRLQAAQDRQSRAIAREKHDHQHDHNHDGKRDRPAQRK